MHVNVHVCEYVAYACECACVYVMWNGWLQIIVARPLWIIHNLKTCQSTVRWSICVRARVHMCLRTPLNARSHTHTHTYTNTYIHT